MHLQARAGIYTAPCPVWDLGDLSCGASNGACLHLGREFSNQNAESSEGGRAHCKLPGTLAASLGIRSPPWCCVRDCGQTPKYFHMCVGAYTMQHRK